MPEPLTRNYQSFTDNSHRQMTAPLRTFSVHVAGETNNAHHAFVRHLEGIHQVKMQSPEDSDYVLVFCPVSSRVGTDICEALDSLGTISDDKKIILVVMHHTFDRDHVVAPSSTQVTKPNVITVDSLFYEGNFLNSTRNDIAWKEVQKALGIQPSKFTSWQPSGNKIYNFLRKYRMLVVTGLIGLCVGIIVAVTLIFEKKKN